MDKRKIPDLLLMKRKKEKITSLTAYNAYNATLLSDAGIDLILVGDSVGMVALGYKTTLPVTVEEIAIHTKAVVRGNTRSLVIADMPFLSYGVDRSETIRNAGLFVKTCGADGVKLEGGEAISGTVQRLTLCGIPILGHIGLKPQYVLREGGYKLQGADQSSQEKIVRDAQALEKAGAFAIVLECIPAQLAKYITELVTIPTIGIGAGPSCDGQVLVFNDMIGAGKRKPAKFVKQYQNADALLVSGVEQYVQEVRQGIFPSDEHTY